VTGQRLRDEAQAAPAVATAAVATAAKTRRGR